MNRVTCCDAEELHFEETLLAAFIRIVKNFQEVADHVAIILMPRNHKWIGRPPEAWERLNTALARIENETGVRVRSFEDSTEGRSDLFFDATHLSRYAGMLLHESSGGNLRAAPAE